MKFFRNLTEKYLKSNFALLLMAVFISIFLWLYIALTQYPTVQRTIQHIPVSVDISGTTAGLNGLSVISTDVTEVTVELLASRTQWGSLNSETLEAYFDADSVSNAGTKKLTLKIRNSSGVEYKEVKSIYPASASVVFDKIDTREFHLEPSIPNITAVSGMEINDDELLCQPSAIRITGPSSQLDRIAKCQAVINKSVSLSTSYVLDCDEILLYNEENALIDQSSLKLSDTNVKLSIPIRAHKDVKLTVQIIGAPVNFNKDVIKLKLSEETVTLACNSSQVEIPDTLDIGFISLNDLKPGYVKTFTLSSVLGNTEYINVSDVDLVTVELVSDDLEQTELMLNKDRISISNIPDSSYDYSVLTQRLGVTVVGPADVIDQIGADDIVADVNLLNTVTNSDQFNCYATFSCPEYDNVWVVTNSKVSIKRTKKTE